MGISKQELLSMLDEEELRTATLLIFANKQDMDQAMSPAEVAKELGLSAIKNRKWQIFKTSALRNIGLEDGMEWLVDALKDS